VNGVPVFERASPHVVPTSCWYASFLRMAEYAAE
jgi:hypothetical protein